MFVNCWTCLIYYIIYYPLICQKEGWEKSDGIEIGHVKRPWQREWNFILKLLTLFGFNSISVTWIEYIYIYIFTGLDIYALINIDTSLCHIYMVIMFWCSFGHRSSDHIYNLIPNAYYRESFKIFYS